MIAFSKDGTDRSSSPRGIFGFIARLVITLGLFVFILYKIDLQSAFQTVTRIGYWAFAGSTILLFLNSGLVAPRWQAVLRWYGADLPWQLLLQLAMVGYFFNQVLPSSIGGDALRIWGLRRQGVSLNKASRSVIVDRLFGLGTLFILAAIGLPFVLAESTDHNFQLPFLALLGILTASGLIFLVALRLHGTKSFLRRLQFVFDLAHEIEGMVFTPKVAIPCLIYSGVGNLFPIFCIAWIAAPLGTGLSVADYFEIVPAALLISMFPLSIAGWGVREAAVVACMAEKGVPPETAIVISIVFGVTMTLSALPGGLVWFLTWRAVPNRDKLD